MSLFDGIKSDDVFGLLNKGLDIESQRQTNKAGNIAARLVASTQTSATPTGVDTAKAPDSFLKREVAGVPIWGLLLAGLGLGAALAVWKSR